ncbi:MAG: class II aldolase/adducin family protein [Planctomycetaceae bacterium]|nr:class II aldolase/adducin family protein [Planctomycetaceae bacterium]
MSVIAELTEMGRRMVRANLVAGPGGNISARDGRRMICSPSGYDVDAIPARDWAVVDLARERQVRGAKATCEFELHLRVLQARSDVNFICHSHPATVVGLISGGQDLQPFTPDFVTFVDHVVHLPYMMIGGSEFARAVAQAAAGGANCVAIRNHGLVTFGATMRQALTRTIVIDDQARVQMAALVAGRPRPLPRRTQDIIRKLDFEVIRQKLQ